MKNRVEYIIVHSTQTLPFELHYAFPFNYIIHRNGMMLHPKKVSKRTKSIHVAYVGGIDENRKVCDTRTQDQNEMLLTILTLLISKYPSARIFSAHEILGASNDPGFKVRDWLKSYIPKTILTAA